MSDKEQKLYWQTLDDYGKENSTLSLMFSEFIDNSIRSFEEDDENRIKKGDDLTIKIIIDEYANGDKKYSIIDNANGIVNLDDAMSLHKNSELKSKDGKSNYGVGMKWAIFWIGRNGVIYTKTKNSNEKQGEFIKGNENQVINRIQDSQLNKISTDSGTCIEILEIRKNSTRNLTKNKIDDIKKFIGYRFFNYLKKVNGINFRTNILIVLNKENGEIENIEIEPFNDLQDSELFKLENKKPTMQDRAAYYNENEHYKNKYNSSEILKNLFDLLLENKTIKLDYHIEMQLGNNESIQIPITIGILKKPDINICGVNILQSKRYIMHRVNQCIERKIINNYRWTNNDRSKNGHFKWVIGEIDISKIPYNSECRYIKADKNKSKIAFEENQNLFVQTNFEKALEDFIKDLEPFLAVMAKFTQSTKKTNKEIIKQAERTNSVSSLLNCNDDGNLTFKKEKIRTLFSNEFDWEGKIICIEPNEDQKDFYDKKEGDDGKIIYSFNIGDKKYLPDDLDELKISFITLISLIDIQRTFLTNKDIDIYSCIDKISKLLNNKN